MIFAGDFSEKKIKKMKHPANRGFSFNWLVAQCVLGLCAAQYFLFGAYFSGKCTFVQPSPVVQAALFPTNYIVLSGRGRDPKYEWSVQDLWKVRANIEDGTGAGFYV